MSATTATESIAYTLGTGASDGANPVAGLVSGGDGSFYGTASCRGRHGAGAIFKLTASGTYSTLYSFSALDSNSFNADGAKPPRH